MRDGSAVAAAAITAHPLAREIVTTETVNEMVNRAGHVLRVPARGGDGGHPGGRHPRLHDHQRGLRPAARVGGRWPRWTTGRRRKPRTPLISAARRLLDRAARWLLTRRPQPLDVRAEIDRYVRAGRAD